MKLLRTNTLRKESNKHSIVPLPEAKTQNPIAQSKHFPYGYDDTIYTTAQQCRQKKETDVGTTGHHDVDDLTIFTHKKMLQAIEKIEEPLREEAMTEVAAQICFLNEFPNPPGKRLQ